MNNVKNKNNFSLYFIIFLTSFVLGIVFSFIIANKINISLLKTYENWYKSIQNDLDLEKFWDVYNVIKKEWYESKNLDKDQMIESAIKWLVEWLWDKHSEYFNIKDTENFNESLNWNFEWIWAIVEKTDIWIKIERVIKWSPALESWILNWDIIIKADWEELINLSLYDWVNKIKWPAWTKVNLDIIRKWKLLKFNVTRWKISIPSVDSKRIWDIWYISLNRFWPNSSTDFEDALEKLRNTEWLIIDLRDNWGWYLISAVEILWNLIEDWEILVSTKYNKLLSSSVYKSSNLWNIYNKNILVLINENSASASEILAWALSDHNKAIIVWKKSYWKGSVQQQFEFWDKDRKSVV